MSETQESEHLVSVSEELSVWGVKTNSLAEAMRQGVLEERKPRIETSVP